jgi:hypothetical protein
MKRLTIAVVLALALAAGTANEAKAHSEVTIYFGFGCVTIKGCELCPGPHYPPPRVYSAYGAGAFGGFHHGYAPGPGVVAWPGVGIGCEGYGY